MAAPQALGPDTRFQFGEAFGLDICHTQPSLEIDLSIDSSCIGDDFKAPMRPEYPTVTCGVAAFSVQIVPVVGVRQDAGLASGRCTSRAYPSPCALVVVRAAPRAAGRDQARKAFVGGLAAPRDCGHFCHPRPMFRRCRVPDRRWYRAAARRPRRFPWRRHRKNRPSQSTANISPVPPHQF